MRSGAACVATLLIALWMTAAAEPNFQRRHGNRHGHNKTWSTKPNRPRGFYYKQNDEMVSEDTPHKGFALQGHAYYEGQFVKCPPKKTLVCKDNNCIVPNCDDIKYPLDEKNKTKICKSGEHSYLCKSPLVCECDNDAGYFESTDKRYKGKCILDTECYAIDGGVKPEKRCPYIGCSDSINCNEVWTPEHIPCTSENELENCTEPELRCPLGYYWDESHNCVIKDQCVICTIPHQVPLCPSPKCPALNCENVWDLRHGGNACPRPQEYPNCKHTPECTCDPTFDFVLHEGKCLLSSQCVSCPEDEVPYCPGQDGCVERTYVDIYNNTDNKPCEPLTTHRCLVKPKCQCLYPLIRDEHGKCVGLDKLFPECDGDDSSIPVCKVDGCDVRHCGNIPFNKKNLCLGTDEALYHCSKNKIFCQCNKGNIIYNLGPDSSGSRLTCNTIAMCKAINDEKDDYDYRH